MKILAVADHVDPLVYSLGIKERFSDIDCTLGAGDLDIAYYEYIVSTLNKSLYFVFGNHNLKNLSYFRKPPILNPLMDSNDSQGSKNLWGYGSICIDGKIVRNKKNDLIIAGLGGSRRYNIGEHQFTETQMFFRVLKLIPAMVVNKVFHGRWLDLLLTHASPSGIHDRDDPCHKGFKTFLWFMRVFKPRFLVHGHVHLYDLNAKRETRYYDTTVLNAYDHIVIDREYGMQTNSYINQQAEQDFVKARKKAWVDSLKTIVNPESSQLLSFDDIKSLLKPGNEKYLGMKAVSIESIVGSEDRYQDFSRHFFPRREHLRNRWMNIDKAYLTDIILPPIKLLKIDEMYFVRDGNHRVSVARSQGVQSIDAEVIELTSEISLGKGASREDILRAVLSYERKNVLARTSIDQIIPVEMITFTTSGRWHELIKHIGGHKYFLNMDRNDEISFEEAAISWYNTIYLPVIELIRKENLLPGFPGRTEADLYLWIIKHWHSLKEQYGPDYPLIDAATEYASSYGNSFFSIIGRYFRNFFRIQKKTGKGLKK